MDAFKGYAAWRLGRRWQRWLRGPIAIAVVVGSGGAAIAIEPAVDEFLNRRTNQCQGCDLRGVDLHNVSRPQARLRQAQLQRADLGNSNFEAAYFTCANLQGANLQNTDLRYANLVDANLMGADLRGADLGNSDLSGALLDETTQLDRSTRFEGAKLWDAATIYRNPQDLEGLSRNLDGDLLRVRCNNR